MDQRETSLAALTLPMFVPGKATFFVMLSVDQDEERFGGSVVLQRSCDQQRGDVVRKLPHQGGGFAILLAKRQR